MMSEQNFLIAMLWRWLFELLSLLLLDANKYQIYTCI